MGFLPVKKELYGVLYALVVNLAIEVLIGDLCPLLGSDVAQKVGAKVPGDGDVVRAPGVARGVYQPGIEPEKDLALNFACGDLFRLKVLSVEEIYCLRHHLHMSELLGGDIEKEVLYLGVLDAKAL